MTLAWAEAAARLFEPPPPPRWATPGDLARDLDPTTAQTPALDVIDQALVDLLNTPDGRLIVQMSPQEGKSTRVAEVFPVWALTQNPDLRVVLASYSHDLAQRNGRVTRDHVANNPQTLGMSIRRDVSAQHQWQLDGHKGGVYAVGIGGSLTGRPADLMVIDDPIKDPKEADSATFRDRVWDWWQAVAKTRLAPGAPVVLILTRWHEDDLAGRLLAAEDGHRWKVVSIPAQCEDPATDPLGREAGEYMVSARGRTTEQWEAIKVGTPSRWWAAQYQQHPSPVEGAVWKHPWIDLNRARTGDVHHRLKRVVVSIDPAAKSKRSSDYTGIIVAGLDDQGHGWVLDDRTLRGTPVEWAMAAWDALLDWQAGELIVEDNQGGEMVLEVLRTAWYTVSARRRLQQLAPHVTPVTSTQSKRVRAEAVAAYYETGRVHHAADGTTRLALLEQQMLTWTGDGDSPDRIDALVHGLTALFLPQHSGDGARPRPVRRATRTR